MSNQSFYNSILNKFRLTQGCNLEKNQKLKSNNHAIFLSQEQQSGMIY